MVGNKIKNKTSVFDILNIVVLTLISITTLYPFIYLLFVSVSPVEEIMKSGIILFPTRIVWDSYRYVIRSTGIGNAYLVTIYITVLGTLIYLFMGSIGAYVLANKSVPGRNFFMTLIIITMMFNGGIIPFFLTVKYLHLINSLWALMIPNAINAFWLIVMRNFFQSIPASLGESARIDGCSEYRILFNIILPLSLPVIATMALFHGVGQWNTYFSAVIFINDPKKMPLQVLIRSMYQSEATMFDSDMIPPPVECIRASTIMLATLPILCAYPLLQRYFVQGIMVGAVKG